MMTPFEILAPPITLQTYAYKGFSAMATLENGECVVITAATEKVLRQIFAELFAKQTLELIVTTATAYKEADDLPFLPDYVPGMGSIKCNGEWYRWHAGREKWILL